MNTEAQTIIKENLEALIERCKTGNKQLKASVYNGTTSEFGYRNYDNIVLNNVKIAAAKEMMGLQDLFAGDDFDGTFAENYYNIVLSAIRERVGAKKIDIQRTGELQVHKIVANVLAKNDNSFKSISHLLFLV
jgi:hypothetical protein